MSDYQSLPRWKKIFHTHTHDPLDKMRPWKCIECEKSYYPEFSFDGGGIFFFGIIVGILFTLTDLHMVQSNQDYFIKSITQWATVGFILISVDPIITGIKNHAKTDKTRLVDKKLRNLYYENVIASLGIGITFLYMGVLLGIMYISI